MWVGGGFFIQIQSRTLCYTTSCIMIRKFIVLTPEKLLGIAISTGPLLFCTYFIKEPNKKVTKVRKKNGVKKKKKSSIKKLIKSDQNCDELGNIYDHMRDFFKFESSNVKENGKIENEFSCLSCLGSGGLWRF